MKRLIKNKKIYVLLECKRKAHWVQNITHDPKISFQVDNQTFNGYGRVIENVGESDLIH